MTLAPPPPDLRDLYAEFAPQLKQIVRGGVEASDPVVEDACQAAWTRLIGRRAPIGVESALAWLTRTAVHEAVRLGRRDLRELSLEDESDPRAELRLVRIPEPEEHRAQHDRLALLRHLPRRQQRVLWLLAFGLSYPEMARHEGCTSRSVKRQVERARQRLRRLEALETA